MPARQRTTAHWYLIQCKPRQDARAELNLRNQNFTCYRPVRTVECIRHGRRVQVEESMFPGYLFIRLDRIVDNWYSIRSTRGVLRMVTFGSEPAEVAADIIYTIKTGSERAVVKPVLKAGDCVRITQGPFRELEAIFLREDGAERAILLLNLLHREQRLKMPLNSIVPAPRYISAG